ncbi:MAG TPA: septal ring lytic transglycosylase RlpA family protein [Pseudolabrys sp.]|nr:septal ring lytic transglycosylase RlpA family protein [Pseudolabrys sp.]
MRVVALAAGSLALANCSGGLSGKVDPKYGVHASARVVEPGEPVPKGGGVYRVGKPYSVAGRTYVPEEDINYKAEGMASWYGDDFHGRYTANGEVFDMNSISAAHPTMPLPSYARVTNLKNHKSIVVRVNDRGPYAANRVIDLSVKTAKLLGFYGQGLTKVKVEYVGKAPLAGSDDVKLAATLRDGGEPGSPKPVMVASNKLFVPALFDKRPMIDIPRPPARPFAASGTREASLPETDDEAGVAEPPAPAHAKPMQAFARAPDSVPSRAASPVSAYASARYDGHAGFMSGRGLY